MICPYCHQETPADQDHCQHCDQPLNHAGQASGDTYQVGDIRDSKAVAIGPGARAEYHEQHIHQEAPKPPPPPPFMPEKPPDAFVPRPAETHALLAALLGSASGPVAITTALRGAGGYGKTTLAQHICTLPEVQQAFPDGILWVTLGVNPNLTGGLSTLHAALTGERPGFASQEDAANALAAALGDKRCLLVTDDVWNLAHLRPFLRRGEHCARLVTTRNKDTLPENAHPVDVDAMRQSEALALLCAGLLSEQTATLAPRLQALATQMGEWPLLLKLANGALRSRAALQPLDQALAHLETAYQRRGLNAFNARDAQSRSQAVEQSISVSLELLEADEMEHYRALAVFPEDADIPLSVVARLWGLDGFETEELCEKLYTLSLLLRFDPAAQRIRLHDVIRKYLRDGWGAAGLLALHNRLLEAYQAGLPAHEPGTPAPWHAGPQDGYYFQTLAYHLARAGRQAELEALLSDFQWLHAKLEASEINALIRDYDLLDLSEARLRPLRLIQSALRLSAHVLSGDKTQLAAQLLGRLLDLKEDEIRHLLAGAKGYHGAPWLRPLHACLEPPGGPLVRTLQGHTDGVYAVALTPDGRQVISGSWDHTLKVWDLASGQEVRTLQGHKHWVIAVALTPDGRQVISGSSDHTLKVWDLATGQEVRTLLGHTDGINAVAVTPDGQHIISGSRDHTLKIWEMATGREVYRLLMHTDGIKAVAVTPDGQHIISSSQDNTLKVWEVATGQEVHTLLGHTDGINAVAVTPDGQHIISGSMDHTLKIWEVATGQEVRTLQGHTYDVNAVAVAPDGQHIISGSSDNTLKIWEAARSGKWNSSELHSQEMTLQGHTSTVNAVAVAPDGQHIISGSWDNTLKIWEVATGREVRTLQGHTDWVNAVAVTPDGRQVISGSDDNTLKVWEMATGQEVHTLLGHTDGIKAVAVTPDGQHIISGSSDNTLKIWEVATGQEVRTLQGHIERGVTAIAVTPDGQHIISGSWQALKVWEAATGREVYTLQRHTDDVQAVAVTPDGRLIISSSQDNTLKVWEMATGREIRTLVGHTNIVKAVAVTPDGQYIISGSFDKTLKVWEMDTGREVRTLWGHTGWVNAVAVTPDGQHIISGSWDNTLKIWEVARSGEWNSDEFHSQEMNTLQGHTKLVTAVAVTPNGQYIISGSFDKTLKVWEVATGREVHTLQGHTANVWAVAVTPDGQYVISGSSNALKVWEVATGQEVHTLQRHTYDGVFAVAVTPDGQHIISGSRNNALIWEAATGQGVRSLWGHTYIVRAVAVTPDGQHIISGSGDKTLKVWEMATGREVCTLLGHTDAVQAVAVTPDGQHIISGSGDKTLKVWEMATGREVCTLLGHTDGINAMAVTPDGQQVISGSDDNTLKVWDLAGGGEWHAPQCRLTFQADGPVHAVAIAPDGRTVIAGDGTGRVYFLRIEGL